MTTQEDLLANVGSLADDRHAEIMGTLLRIEDAIGQTPPPEPGPNPEPSPGLGTPHLPFDLDLAALNASPRRALASWMPFFPLRLTATGDYYANNYWTPTPSNSNEATKWAKYGGYLRDRAKDPASPEGINADEAEIMDALVEIDQASSAGIDGFFLCIEEIADSGPRNWQRCKNVARASTESPRPFTIAPMPDLMAGSVKGATPQTLADRCAELIDLGNAERTPEGDYVVAPFAAEQWGADKWQAFLDRMEDLSKPCALIPMFNASMTSGQVTQIIPLCFAVSQWGGRSPATVQNADRYADEAHARGQAFMQFVCIQDIRPKMKTWDEALNTECLRTTMRAAINGEAEYVHLVTWNDYSEASHFNPSWRHGWGFLDLTTWGLTEWKLGAPPETVRSARYISAKTQPSAAQPTLSYPDKMTLRSGSSPARDKVETLIFEPGTEVQVTLADPASFSSSTADPIRIAPGIDYTKTPLVQDTQYLIWSSLR